MVRFYFSRHLIKIESYFKWISYLADPVGFIFDGLRIKRPKPKIKEKLLELNLVDDIKQLRKKRAKKSDGEQSLLIHLYKSCNFSCTVTFLIGSFASID